MSDSGPSGPLVSSSEQKAHEFAKSIFITVASIVYLLSTIVSETAWPIEFNVETH